MIKRVTVLTSLTLLFACVQEEHLKTITFKVDMSNMENIGNVGIRGQFTNPPWQVTLPMTDRDGDGIYELTLSETTAQSSVAFKFVNQDNVFELDCKPNRTIQFEYKPETLEYHAIFNVEGGEQKSIKP